MGRMALAAISLACCAAGLPACSSDPNWPAIAKIAEVSDILTPEQRDKAVHDLQKSDQNHGGEANGGSAKQAQ